MARAIQQDLFGGTHVAGNLVDRLEYLLEEHPEAREDYMTGIVLYWLEFDGLQTILGDKADAFREWFMAHAKSPKTIQNRIMEIQNRRPDLEASRDVEQVRQRLARAGPIVH
jgi:hypothetical protein